MKKLLLTLLLLGFIQPVFAAGTWFVRTDGSDTICSGAADAAVGSLSGTGQACAKKTLFGLVQHTYSSGGGGQVTGTNVIAGGDTVVIGDPGATPGQFEIGYDSAAGLTPSLCSASFAGECYLWSLPSGPDSSHKTTIAGRQYNTGCTTQTQIWGTNAVNSIWRNTLNSNLAFNCLEFTDHSNCRSNGPINTCSEGAYPRGPFGKYGLLFYHVTNLDLTHVSIHGMSRDGMSIPEATGTFNFSYVDIIANSWAGLEQDYVFGGPSPTQWTATINVDHSRINWNGCNEKYPLVAALDSINNISTGSCSEQNEAVYSDGWGGGTSNVNGNYNISDTEFMHNTQDGFDTRDNQAGMGATTLSRVRAEGNAGQQLKVSSLTTRVENSVIIGNCGYFAGLSITNPGSGSATFNSCRAGGGPVFTFSFSAGSSYKFYNDIITSNGDESILFEGNNCTGDSFQVKNSIILGGLDIPGGDQSDFIFNFAQGTNCAALPMLEDYNTVFNMKTGAASISGSHSRYIDPQLAGESTLKMQTYPGYQGTTGLTQVALTASSPARFGVTGVNSADETLTFSSYGTSDFFHIVRPSSWDAGPLQFASCGADSTFCQQATDCCTGSCNSNRCGVATCSVDGVSCSVNGDCCNGVCSSGVCGLPSCTSNGGSCSINSNCCSSICQTGQCVAIACTNDQSSCSSNGQCCNGLCSSSICGFPNGTACSTSSQCINNNCNSNICANNNGGSCSTGTDCVSGTCSGGTCVTACTTNGNSCSIDGTCCSGNCCSGSCTASACPVIGAPSTTNLKIQACKIKGNLKLR